MADISPITVARFWSKVSIPNYDNRCWEWQGSRNPEGYGKFRLPGHGRTVFGAHRVSYMLYNGLFPDPGLVVRHKCDNPCCVNPFHLEPGTVKDNAQDAKERGRLRTVDQRGENNGAARLTEALVSVIKLRIANGEKNTVIAKDFGVTHSLISRIRKGKSWAHV